MKMIRTIMGILNPVIAAEAIIAALMKEMKRRTSP